MNRDLAWLETTLGELGARELLVKRLAPNDNSKNQIYLGKDLATASVLPTGNVTPSPTTSGKRSKSSVKFFLELDLVWLGAEGELVPAPNAKLIFYPQYPEVRLSGFLNGVPRDDDRSELLNVERRGREEGRLLVLAVIDEQRLVAALVDRHSCFARELTVRGPGIRDGVFERYPLGTAVPSTDSREALLRELCRIGSGGWIDSKRLDRNGRAIPYTAPNGGGYTLEAELGVVPNGVSEPDYLGWEVKQIGVPSFESRASPAITLMTPEPTGGFYRTGGVEAFMQRYGYPDTKGRDRRNFSSIHRSGVINRLTGLTLALPGVDHDTGVIGDQRAGVALLDANGSEAAVWSYASLIEHWKKKHERAVYVRSMKQTGSGVRYRYSTRVSLGEGASTSRLLRRFCSGAVFYDPAISMKDPNTAHPKIKRRSQFRMKLHELPTLYRRFDEVEACAGVPTSMSPS